MCGIVGYIGKTTKLKAIVEKLKKLEYRGYDSAGVFAANKNKEITLRSVGNIAKLEEILPSLFDTNISIAHTRWATHGKPRQDNCHPHVSKNGNWKVVHNGIIENYQKLKEQLTVKPDSECDTAVLTQFLEEKGASEIKSFIDCFENIEGSYAIAAIKDGEDKLYLAKNRSPLYVAKTALGWVVASDPICFSNETNKYYSLNDGEFAEIGGNGVVFYDNNKKILQKSTKNTKKIENNEKRANFKHYMLKEIFEQKEAIETLLKFYKKPKVFAKINKEFVRNINKILLLGCGTAYHAAMAGARYFEEIAHIPASAEIASEFVYKSPVFIDEKTLVIAVSQSGETADTIKAVSLAKEVGAKAIALTNVEYSTIVSKSDFVLPVCAGPEIAVASTKAFVCQLCVLYVFACYLANKKKLKTNNCFEELEYLSNNILNFDKNQIDSIAEEIKNRDDCIFIGKNIDYIIATEASLKLKEVSYINSMSYPAGELKHGFLAMVSEGTPLFVFATQENINKKSYNAASEAGSRGAVQIIVTNEEIIEEKNAKIIKIMCKNKYLAPIMAIVPMQYLAYKVSISKNINPDQPRNLAKSVTVE